MMNKFCITFIIIFASVGLSQIVPIRPKNVPNEAKWFMESWYLSDKYLGGSNIWYKDGKIMVNRIKIDTKHMKEISYFENGKIRVIGQNILLENKYRKGNKRFEWRAYGKWKTFNKEGVLISEACYTQVYDASEGEWQSEYCGEEIKYNDKGTVKERINHKYECKYGCEELEYKGSSK